jgi:hypothetical protein
VENPRDVYNPILYCPHTGRSILPPFFFSHSHSSHHSPFLSSLPLPKSNSFHVLIPFSHLSTILFPFFFPHLIFPLILIHFSSLPLPFLTHISSNCYILHFSFRFFIFSSLPSGSMLSSLNLPFVVPCFPLFPSYFYIFLAFPPTVVSFLLFFLFPYSFLFPNPHLTSYSNLISILSFQSCFRN